MQIINKRLALYSILIVEDDPSTLKWLSRVLKIYFKDVYIASDAMKALEIFTSKTCNIVMADIQMPEVDGLSFLQKIATISPETFRIVMTAFNSNVYINRAVESDVHFYLKKPIDIDELLVAIASHMPEIKTNVSVVNLGKSFFYDFEKKVLYKDKLEFVKLTKKELQLLELLIKNRQGIVYLDMIEQQVYEESVSADAIRMIVVGLRKKIYTDLIENIKGLGYRLNIS